MLPLRLKKPRDHGGTPSPHARKILIGILLLGAISFLRILQFLFGKCDTRTHMKDMLFKTTDILQENNIEYWLDKGTLLGIHRDDGLIPWEYDVDLGVVEETCEMISKVKDQFLAKGLVAYDREDYIPHKVKLTYDTENHRFYYSDPHLHDPCVRVYDENDLGTWVDIYWYKRVPNAEVMDSKSTGKYLIPPNYDEEDDLLCCSEGIHEITENMCCGGCVPSKVVFPLRREEVPVPRNGEKTHSQWIPSNSREFLAIQYGESSLQERVIKGWKGVVCAYWVSPRIYFFCLIILLSGFGYALAKVFQRYHIMQRLKAT